MSELNGTLRDFPLRQVLRLIETGKKTGILVVTAETVRGSVFFRDGRVIFATTRSGPGRSEESLSERRRPTEADEARILTSVVMRLLRLEDGTFVFQSGVEPMHPSTGDLSVEEVLEGAEKLLDTWNEVEESLGSMTQGYVVRPTTDGAEVVLSPEEWNVVAAIGDGRTPAQVALKAGLSEFAAASAMARLLDRKLLAPVELPEQPIVDQPTTTRDRGRPDPEPVPPLRPSTEGAAPTPEPTLAQRYEFYVNSRGAELREPPPDESGIVLDLTTEEGPTLDVRSTSTDEDEPEPASELAQRWRDLRRGRPTDDE